MDLSRRFQQSFVDGARVYDADAVDKFINDLMNTHADDRIHLQYLSQLMANSLANNLCKDHKAVMQGQPCAACTIRTLQGQLEELSRKNTRLFDQLSVISLAQLQQKKHPSAPENEYTVDWALERIAEWTSNTQGVRDCFSLGTIAMYILAQEVKALRAASQPCPKPMPSDDEVKDVEDGWADSDYDPPPLQSHGE
jgi:hypothetical protein